MDIFSCLQRVSHISDENFVDIDETHVDEKEDFSHDRGWSPEGEPCRIPKSRIGDKTM